MTFEEYQKLSERTMAKGQTDMQLGIWGLGLAGEVGEAVDCIKKALGHGQRDELYKLVDELGDILFYIAAICSHQGWDMGTIAKVNVNKLKLRYPDGFVEGGGNDRG